MRLRRAFSTVARLLLLVAAALAGACASPWADGAAAVSVSAPVLLLGEQHDAAEHQHLARRTVQALARQGRLRVLALEMAERGRDTAGLPPDAAEATVRERLAWNERGWPWEAYGPIVMAAVRAGVTVRGANLPRAQMGMAMVDARWDAAVPETVRQLLIADVRDGHCGLLPEAHLPGMARVQIARDAAMARTVLDSLGESPQGVVVLVAGSNHVARDRGVPVHLLALQPGLAVQAVAMRAGPPDGRESGFDEVRITPALQRPDPCEALRERWKARPPGG